jgi:hypothetical protein
LAVGQRQGRPRGSQDEKDSTGGKSLWTLHGRKLAGG